MIGSGVNAQDLEFIKQLAYVSGLRGKDGTGILQGYTYSNRSMHRIVKGEQDVSYFLWFHEYAKGGDRDLLNNVADNFFAGHVRAATHGVLSDENAHPFEFGNIIGMHNGTLKDTKYTTCSNGRTDSECMFEDINNRGIRPVLRELDPKSAYAIVMFDKEDGSFYFIRNNLRPLHYFYNKKRKVFYWASEWEMLEFVADRVGLDVGEAYVFSPYLLYNFKPLDVQVNKSPTWRVWDLKPKEEKKEEKKPNTPSLSLIVNNNKPVIKIKAEGRRIDHKVCTGCKKTLSLYESYKAKREGDNYICEPCVELQDKISELVTVNSITH